MSKCCSELGSPDSSLTTMTRRHLSQPSPARGSKSLHLPLKEGDPSMEQEPLRALKWHEYVQMFVQRGVCGARACPTAVLTWQTVTWAVHGPHRPPHDQETLVTALASAGVKNEASNSTNAFR